MDEFHGHLDSQATKFSERVFSILDQDLSGHLDLREFIIGVWNYCTYDTTLISKVISLKDCSFRLYFGLFLFWRFFNNAVDRHETPPCPPCVHHVNNARALKTSDTPSNNVQYHASAQYLLTYFLKYSDRYVPCCAMLCFAMLCYENL